MVIGAKSYGSTSNCNSRMSSPFQKTPPKNTDKIRSALEAVRQGVDRQVAAGPYRDGLAADARVVIAAFHQPEAARQFQDVLLRAGVMSGAAESSP